MLDINDLIGLPYRWGGKPSEGFVDCFQLHNEIRRRLGLSDKSQEFAFAYEQWTEATFPQTQLMRWLKSECTVCKEKTGAIVLMQGNKGRGALGTIVGHGDVSFISLSGVVIRTKVANLGEVRLFWAD